MAQYCARDGVPDDWHLVHLGSRAHRRRRARVHRNDLRVAARTHHARLHGLWNEQQRDAWRRIVDFVHAHSQREDLPAARPLGAQRIDAVGLGENRTIRCREGNWPLISASPLPYIEGVSQVPRGSVASRTSKQITEQFVTAARLGIEAGFDMIELHMAHGYLLASFLSPLTNRRTDAVSAARSRIGFASRCASCAPFARACPQAMPLSVRISASDWARDGLTEADLLGVARALRDAGADVIDVSSGQTVPWQKPVYGRMYQTPFSDLIRNTLGVPTIAVGNIYEADHVNSIVASGRADLCAHCAAAPCEPIVDAAGRRRAAVRRAVVAAAVSVGQESARAQSATRRVAGGGGMSASLNGEHALVTGASRGIGAAIARTLAERGARVSLLGRDRART